MARFLKVDGSWTVLDSKRESGPRWINVYTIDEVTGISSTRKDPDTGQDVTEVTDSRFYLHHEDENSTSSYYYVPGKPETWIAKIDEIIANDIAGHHPEHEEDDPQPQEGVYTTSWKDTWKPGKQYAFWDVVAHPDNHARRFLALKPNASTSVLVLSNDSFWCEIPATAT